MPKNKSADEKLELLNRIYKSGDVTKACENEGIGRATYYRWRKAVAVNGANGLMSKSRKPKNSPAHTSKATERKILKLAKSRNYRFASEIRRVLKQGGTPISVNTIIKILGDNGLWNRVEIPDKNNQPIITHIY